MNNLLNSFMLKLFYAPDGDGSGGAATDDIQDDIAILEDLDDPDNKDDKDDLDDDDNKDDLDKDDDDDFDDDSSDKDEDKDKKRADKDDKDSDDKSDDDEDDKDKKEETEEEKKAREEAEKNKPIEAKDLSPRALKDYDKDIYKHFPELKDVLFQNKEYNKLFGSVEDAQEAREKAELLDEISATTLQGDPTELVVALKKTGDNVLEEFSNNFLVKLKDASKDLYYRVTDPIIGGALKAAFNHASKTGDKNLKLASQYMSQFIFSDSNIPEFNNGRKKEEDPEKIKLQEDRNNENRKRLQEHESAVFEYTERKLKEIITDGLDPGNVYNTFVKEALTDKIIERVGQVLKNDRAFQGQMAALWKKGVREGFTREIKSRIAHTYLAKAKRIVPGIRNKVRADAPADKQDIKRDNKGKKIIPSTNDRNKNRSTIPNDPKKIDWNKTSDDDILAAD